MAGAKPKTIPVTITPDASKPEGVDFFIDPKDLKFKNNHHEGFDVTFKIVDDQKTGYLFPDDMLEAMWVQPVGTNPQTSCPTSAVYWDQFKATGVTNGNTSLEVRDPNEFAQDFAFTLRFTKKPKDNGPCVPYDPIGSNQNGPTEFNYAALGIGVLAVGAVAFAALKLFSDTGAMR